MATNVTKEEHERSRRRRMRQLLGAGLFVLILIGLLNVVGALVGGVAALFDDTDKKKTKKTGILCRMPGNGLTKMGRSGIFAV